MNEDRNPTPLTRGDVYPHLGGAYILCAAALLRVAQHETSSLAQNGVYGMAAGSLLLGFTFAIWGLRERWGGRGKEHAPAEHVAAGDRPRE